MHNNLLYHRVFITLTHFIFKINFLKINCRGATASGRSREAHVRQIERAEKLQDKTYAQLKKRAKKKRKEHVKSNLR